MADGEAGPGAGGQQLPDQSAYGPMGSSLLSLGETSLVSVMLGQPGWAWSYECYLLLSGVRS